jgi:hypothetical protein
MMLSRLAPSARRAVTARSFATRRKTKDISLLAPEVYEALPIYNTTAEPPARDPERGPVTSAHCIDVVKKQVSALDSAALSPNGTVVHGIYGDLGAAEGIPLEYLALLRHAAEGCAAVRTTVEKSKAKKGTILIYGAGEASALAAAQVASADGHAVVAVVSSEQSGNDDFMECLKGMIAEPGTVVPEEYALSKKLFAELVEGISTGKDGTEKAPSAATYLTDFKKNFADQCEAYPDTRSAAVSEKHLDFKYMEKDHQFWEENMAAYLEQFPPGAPPVDKAKLDALFTVEQYEIFRRKFWEQTTGVISGDDTPFSAPHIVQQQLMEPGKLNHATYPGAGADFPYAFSVLKQFFPEGTAPTVGGPILGAIIAVTPDLQKAAEAVAAAKTIRGKAEALHFLTAHQKASLGAVRSVIAQATAVGTPVTVLGGKLAGVSDKPMEATPADVKTALAAMDIDDMGKTKLNYFVQVYRAGDFPFYGDYAVHQATDVMTGPRQIIVTK